MKKNNILKYLFILLAGGISLQACKKDETPDTTPAKVKQLMFNWKITGISTPKKLDPATDSSILKPCTTDDLIKFSNTGFDFSDGTTKCDSTIFPYSKGSWSYNLTDDSIKLYATAPAKYLSWKVTKLNDSILEIKYLDSISPVNKATKKMSFKH